MSRRHPRRVRTRVDRYGDITSETEDNDDVFKLEKETRNGVKIGTNIDNDFQVISGTEETEDISLKHSQSKIEKKREEMKEENPGKCITHLLSVKRHPCQEIITGNSNFPIGEEFENSAQETLSHTTVDESLNPETVKLLEKLQSLENFSFKHHQNKNKNNNSEEQTWEMIQFLEESNRELTPEEVKKQQMLKRKGYVLLSNNYQHHFTLCKLSFPSQEYLALVDNVNVNSFMIWILFVKTNFVVINKIEIDCEAPSPQQQTGKNVKKNNQISISDIFLLEQFDPLCLILLYSNNTIEMLDVCNGDRIWKRNLFEKESFYPLCAYKMDVHPIEGILVSCYIDPQINIQNLESNDFSNGDEHTDLSCVIHMPLSGDSVTPIIPKINEKNTFLLLRSIALWSKNGTSIFISSFTSQKLQLNTTEELKKDRKTPLQFVPMIFKVSYPCCTLQSQISLLAHDISYNKYFNSNVCSILSISPSERYIATIVPNIARSHGSGNNTVNNTRTLHYKVNGFAIKIYTINQEGIYLHKTFAEGLSLHGHTVQWQNIDFMSDEFVYSISCHYREPKELCSQVHFWNLQQNLYYVSNNAIPFTIFHGPTRKRAVKLSTSDSFGFLENCFLHSEKYWICISHYECYYYKSSTLLSQFGGQMYPPGFLITEGGCLELIEDEDELDTEVIDNGDGLSYDNSDKQLAINVYEQGDADFIDIVGGMGNAEKNYLPCPPIIDTTIKNSRANGEKSSTSSQCDLLSSFVDTQIKSLLDSVPSENTTIPPMSLSTGTYSSSNSRASKQKNMFQSHVSSKLRKIMYQKALPKKISPVVEKDVSCLACKGRFVLHTCNKASNKFIPHVEGDEEVKPILNEEDEKRKELKRLEKIQKRRLYDKRRREKKRLEKKLALEMEAMMKNGDNSVNEGASKGIAKEDKKMKKTIREKINTQKQPKRHINDAAGKRSISPNHPYADLLKHCDMIFNEKGESYKAHVESSNDTLQRAKSIIQKITHVVNHSKGKVSTGSTQKEINSKLKDDDNSGTIKEANLSNLIRGNNENGVKLSSQSSAQEKPAKSFVAPAKSTTSGISACLFMLSSSNSFTTITSTKKEDINSSSTMLNHHRVLAPPPALPSSALNNEIAVTERSQSVSRSNSLTAGSSYPYKISHDHKPLKKPESFVNNVPNPIVNHNHLSSPTMNLNSQPTMQNHNNCGEDNSNVSAKGPPVYSPSSDNWHQQQRDRNEQIYARHSCNDHKHFSPNSNSAFEPTRSNGSMVYSSGNESQHQGHEHFHEQNSTHSKTPIYSLSGNQSSNLASYNYDTEYRSKDFEKSETNDNIQSSTMYSNSNMKYCSTPPPSSCFHERDSTSATFSPIQLSSSFESNVQSIQHESKAPCSSFSAQQNHSPFFYNDHRQQPPMQQHHFYSNQSSNSTCNGLYHQPHHNSPYSNIIASNSSFEHHANHCNASGPNHVNNLQHHSYNMPYNHERNNYPNKYHQSAPPPPPHTHQPYYRYESTENNVIFPPPQTATASICHNSGSAPR